ncbi:MAG: flagellar biosynthetic protein FliO, partial [Myxococcota bacterium]
MTGHLAAVLLLWATGAVEPAFSAPTAPSATPDASKLDAETPPPTAYDLSQGEAVPRDFEGESLLRQLARTMFGLVVVVGLIYLTLKVLLPRLLNMRQVASGQGLKVLERLQLDPRHALLLIDVRGKQTLLVATGEQGVQVIAHVPPWEEG